ncbi:MAG: isochorismatase family protein [Clostridiales bacterium]|nr:isochorismatase family protein [Clostridiales bacterium]
MKNILIIDVQNGFIYEKNKEIIEKINKYLKENKFLHILYTKYIKTQTDKNNHVLSDGLYDKEDKKIAVKKIPKSKYFNKRTHGLTTQILNYLQKNNIKEIDLCGIDNLGSIFISENMLKNRGIKVNKLNELIYPSYKSIPKTYETYSPQMPTIKFYVCDLYSNNVINNTSQLTEYSTLNFAVLEWLLHTPKTANDLQRILTYYSKFFPITNNQSYQTWANAGCKVYRCSDDNMAIKMCNPIAWYAHTYEEIENLIDCGLICVNNNSEVLLAAKIICTIILYLRRGTTKKDLIIKLKQHFDLAKNNLYIDLIKYLLEIFIQTNDYNKALLDAQKYTSNKYLATFLMCTFIEAYYNKIPMDNNFKTNELLSNKFKLLLFDFYKQSDNSFKILH